MRKLRPIGWIYFLLLIFGCGTHGSIESYSFELSIDDLVKKVDYLIKTSEEFTYHKPSSNGWIYISLPTENTFGFRISKNLIKLRNPSRTEIVLISAGDIKNGIRWSKDIGFFKEIRYMTIFKNDFIEPLRSLNKISTKDKVVKCPFVSSTNSINMLDFYMIKKDTFIEYPLPRVLDSLGYFYFENIIKEYSKTNKEKVKFNQFYKMFSINDEYTGIIKDDKIIINAFYRNVGEKIKFNTIFEDPRWKNYTASSNFINIFETVKKYQIPNGTSPNDEFSKDYWMVDYLEKNGY